jgi:hypothetical protein
MFHVCNFPELRPGWQKLKGLFLRSASRYAESASATATVIPHDNDRKLISAGG